MSRKRRCYESGHVPKYLVIIDDTPECERAVYFAARRAGRLNTGLVMLRFLQTDDHNQQWLGVKDIMREEAFTEANKILEDYALKAQSIAQISTQRIIRDGEPIPSIAELIDEDEDIAILVLAAGTGKDGPGPLVSAIGKIASNFPIPVTLVPGDLTDEELDALT